MENSVLDCGGNPFPVFALGKIESVFEEDGARPRGSVFHLCVAADSPKPCAGQFYLLRARKSAHFLARPISVFCAETLDSKKSRIEFLILKKGSGTIELSNLKIGDEIELLGPLGNSFPLPSENERVAIVGGGIGVAPVAGFALNLPEKSYDFFAAFKSGSYGLEKIRPKNLFITTDDGSVGTHGMISAELTESKIRDYDVVYACGPLPMLAYIQKICAASGVKSWLSMENRMACGLGACLGCTIQTTTDLFLTVRF